VTRESDAVREVADESATVAYALAPGPWLAVLRSVVSAAEASDVRELEVRAYGLRVALRRAGRGAQTPGALTVTEHPSESSQYHPIHTPLTGIWYDAASPGSPPYVRVGDIVDVGTVVGLVETMKVFNEVTADAVGVVREVLVRRGDLVTAQATVMLVELGEPSFTPSGI
jgi:biotin carboxyl carrier protein